MRNLFRLASLACIEGFFYKPRIDREILPYSAGLIGTTGCPGGEVQTRLRIGQYDAAAPRPPSIRDIFGTDHFYLELMDHGLEIESRLRADLMRLAGDLGLPPLATNDLHYTFERDADAHGVLLACSPARPGRPQAVQVRRQRLLPEVRGSRCGATGASCPRPATTPCCRRASLGYGDCSADLMPRFEVPDGRDRGVAS